MKPVIPPQVVRLLTGLSYAALADRLGVCRNTVIHLTRKPWAEWTVGDAERLCEAAGLDFWNLTLADSPSVRTAFSRVAWEHTEDPTVRRALDSLIRASGDAPSEVRRNALSAALCRLYRSD